ncbi:hypothetical protein SAMN05428997_1035 [Bosea sp. CRIB-10]|nr:hypothetical protein SAMN05428997_1035 [Bosea sp. CRIB-10]
MRSAPVTYDAGMNPGRTRAPAVSPWMRAPGNWTFVAPEDGTYTLRLRGPGGAGEHASSTETVNGGSGGAFCRKTAVLSKGQAVPITVGLGGRGNGFGNSPVNPSGPTTATLPSGLVTAGAGANGNSAGVAPGGIAVGGDVNLDGGAGGLGSTSGAGGSVAGAAGGAGASLVGGGGASPGDEVLLPTVGTAGRVGDRGVDGIWGAGTGGNRHGSSTNYPPTGNGGDGIALITYDGP